MIGHTSNLMCGLNQWASSQLFNYYAGFRIRLIWLLYFDVGGFGKRSKQKKRLLCRLDKASTEAELELEERRLDVWKSASRHLRSPSSSPSQEHGHPHAHPINSDQIGHALQHVCARVGPTWLAVPVCVLYRNGRQHDHRGRYQSMRLMMILPRKRLWIRLWLCRLLWLWRLWRRHRQMNLQRRHGAKLLVLRLRCTLL